MKDISYQTGRIIAETQFFLGNTTLLHSDSYILFSRFPTRIYRLYVNSY